jgi:hypothetical protein
MCVSLGSFAIDSVNNPLLCTSATTTTLYGTSLYPGNQIFTDSGCTSSLNSSFFSNGNNIFETGNTGAIKLGISGCSCNYLGLFSATSDPDSSCRAPLVYPIYGDSLTIGEFLFSDSGCTTTAALSYYSDGIDVYETDFTGQLIGISGCTCTQFFCVENDSTYDDTYQQASVYGGQFYFTGQTTGYFMFYSTGETRWCLAQNLGDPCDQFGPYGSTSSCPDFDDTVAYTGYCVTTTTTTNPCVDFDFSAIFDCLVTPSPSLTPTNTPTPTPTPTPTSSNPCGGISMLVTASGYTPTPTPTNTPTPSPSPDVTRPCSFSGDVTFSTISEILQCANSKRFTDCFTGVHYYTSDLVLVSGETSPKQGYVYNAVINGQGMCVLFDGLFENISGVDSISLTTEIGSQIDGACLQCIPNLSQTPTPTPTNTPTPTPSVSPCVLYEYRVTNNSPSNVRFNYTSCSGSESGTVPSYSSVIVCSTITPTSSSSNVVVAFLNTVCV